MSEHIHHENPPVAVYFHNNFDGLIAAFQASPTSKPEVVKMMLNTNNICTVSEKEIVYFKFTSDDVNKALLKYRTDYKEVPDHKELVTLFGDLHNYLEKVTVRTIYMNNGSRVTQVFSPCIQHPILIDEGTHLVFTASHIDWWMKNEGLATIIGKIREQLPDFTPWKGSADQFIKLLTSVANKESVPAPLY